jgi:hypothetical protein
MAYQRKTCRDCGSRDEVINGYCEDCSDNYIWCDVCKENHSRDSNLCRHIFWSDTLGWYAGTGYSLDEDYSDIKESLWLILDKLGATFARQLITTIQSGKIAFYYSGSIFGADEIEGDLFDKHGERIQGTTYYIFRGQDYHSQEEADAMKDGWGWLIGLYQTKTRYANKQTISWIRQWTAQTIHAKTRQPILFAREDD